MGRRYSAQLLRTLRNDIDIRPLVEDVLDWPSKLSEGYFRFLCPLCSEFNCAVNPDHRLRDGRRCVYLRRGGGIPETAHQPPKHSTQLVTHLLGIRW